LADEAATLAAGLVLVDLPATDDTTVARTASEKLRDSATSSLGNAEFDVRIFGRFDMSGVTDRIAQAVPQINIPVLFVRGALSDLANEEEAAACGDVRSRPSA
jgi:pimeloyl-ACP methyl ester carboxylesterase